MLPYVRALAAAHGNGNNNKDSENEEERRRCSVILFGLGLDEMELNEAQIPRVISEFIGYFKQNVTHISEQGIFRKAPRD